MENMMIVFLIASVTVFTSPNDACVSAIMREIRTARSDVFVQTDTIQLPDVLNILDLAAKRGVKVTVDATHPESGTTIVIDRKTVFAGSLRLVPRAVGSLFMVKDDPDIALKFSAWMVDHRGHSKRYVASLLNNPSETKLASDASSCSTCGGTKLVTCQRCDGKWSKRVTYEVPCDKSAQVGCGGGGERTCFTCRGAVNQKCAKCKGRGYYSIGKRRVSGTKRTLYAGCVPCGGSGQGFIDSTSYGRNIVRKGSGTVKCAKCVQGKITCPRCDGKGTYQKKGKCPDCKKGKVACPDCA